MKHAVSALLPALFLLVPTAASGKGYPMQPVETAPGIWAVVTPTRDLPNSENRGWNSNSAFIVTEAGVLLIDSGSAEVIGDSLKRVIAEVTDQPVRWIVNTHAHGDHWLGNAAFADTVEKIYASSVVADSIRDEARTWIDRFNDMTGGTTGESAVLAPDTFVDDRTELAFGGRNVVLFPSRDSHSPGDIIAWLPDDAVLVPGDVVYSDRMPSTFDADMQHWIAMLGELVALEPEVVIPGHGEVTDGAGLARLKEFLAALWDAVAAHYEEGMSDFEMAPAVIEELSRFREAYPGLDDKIARDLSHVYLQVEAASF